MHENRIHSRHIASTLVLALLLSLFIPRSATANGHLQVEKEAQRLVLKGKISEALGEYEAHLQGALEYLICGTNGKAYESLIVVEATAEEIHTALGELNVQPGTPPGYDEQTEQDTPATGTEFLIFAEWTSGDKTEKVRAEELVRNRETEKPMQHTTWVYSGSRVVPDLDSEDEDAMIPQAFMSNDLVALRRFDGSALFQNPLPESQQENLYEKNGELLPKLGTPVTVTIETNRTMQLYLRITGKVQGVGFRNFTQRTARELGIKGYAKNMPDGTVEVVAEGENAQLHVLLARLKRGPRYARVDALDVQERPVTAEYQGFSVRY